VNKEGFTPCGIALLGAPAEGKYDRYRFWDLIITSRNRGVGKKGDLGKGGTSFFVSEGGEGGSTGGLQFPWALSVYIPAKML